MSSRRRIATSAIVIAFLTVGCDQGTTAGGNEGAQSAPGSSVGGKAADVRPQGLANADAGYDGEQGVSGQTGGSVAVAQSVQASAIPPAPLSGSRADRIARLLQNLIPASQPRTWDGAVKAFPGARWKPREIHRPSVNGSTRTQRGTIDLAGAVYTIGIEGTADRVNSIGFSSPGDDLVEWGAIARALRSMSVDSQNIGCHSPTGFGYVRLTANGKSAILHKSLNYGSAVPSTDEYYFYLDDPFQGMTEAQVLSDRSLCL